MKPRIFIGSSLEGRTVANALAANLEHDGHCTVWHQAFPLSTSTLDELLTHCNRNDFAAFVFSADDDLTLRTHDYKSPRDNVVIEAGLFMGANGKDRGFIVIPTGTPDLHLPTDLLGLTLAPYDAARAESGEAREALTTAATLIREAISKSTWMKLRPTIHSYPRYKTGLSYPLKLIFEIKNERRDPVVIESLSFKLGRGLRLQRHDKSKPQFMTCPGSKDPKRDDRYEDSCVIEPKQVVTAWIAIDPAQEKELIEAVNAKTAGVWHYRLLWLGERVTRCEYQQEF